MAIRLGGTRIHARLYARGNARGDRDHRGADGDPVPVVSRMRIAGADGEYQLAQSQRISAAINNYFNDYNGYPGVTPNHLFNPTQAASRVLPSLTQNGRPGAGAARRPGHPGQCGFG